MTAAIDPCPRSVRASNLSVTAFIGMMTLAGAGISAWYGMGTRLSLAEAQITAELRTQEATDNALAARIDAVVRDMNAHHGLPSHPVAQRILEEHERRIDVLEKAVEGLRLSRHNGTP